MNDAQKLAAIDAIIHATGDAPPDVPPIVPVPPQPIPPTGDYPTGEALKWILGVLTREYNQNNAAQNAMRGDPDADLRNQFFGGTQGGGDYAKFLQAVADANGAPLLQAAAWLRHGMTLEQVLAQNFAPAQQITDLVHVMQHYNLLPA